MRPLVLLAALLALLLGGCDRSVPPPASLPLQPVTVGTLKFVRSGLVVTYLPRSVERVAIFLSGDGGWSGFNDRVARRMAGEGTLVLGVNTTNYLRIVAASKAPAGQCHSAAADLQMLGQLAQQRLGLTAYREPVIIGYSAGATLAYLAAAEAPTAFRGAISLSFPPDILGSGRRFCLPGAPPAQPIEGGHLYAAVPVRIPFAIVQGADDTVVPPGPARAFAAQVQGATYTEVAGTGHGFAGFGGWWDAFSGAFDRMTGRSPAIGPLRDLPLVEVPATAGVGGPSDLFVVFLSGDGGWADLDSQVAGMIGARGVPVVGWSTLRYFWKEKPPAVAGSDLGRVIEAYARQYGRPRVLLVGYSFGADVLPFMIRQLPPATRARVAGFASIAGSTAAEFQFSTLDWFTDTATGAPVLPQLLALRPLPTLCIYGGDDAGSVCRTLPAGSGVRTLPLPGGHHVGGNFAAMTGPILSLAGSGPALASRQLQGAPPTN